MIVVCAWCVPQTILYVVDATGTRRPWDGETLPTLQARYPALRVSHGICRAHRDELRTATRRLHGHDRRPTA